MEAPSVYLGWQPASKTPLLKPITVSHSFWIKIQVVQLTGMCFVTKVTAENKAFYTWIVPACSPFYICLGF